MFKMKKSDVEFPTSIIISDQNFKITVSISKKKNSSVSVKGNILNFRLSSYLSNKNLMSHFEELLNKISLKIEKDPYHFKETLDIDYYLNQGYFTFNSEKYFFEKTINRGIKLSNNTFYINISLDKTQIEKGIIKLLTKKYFKSLKEHVYNLNEQTYNFSITDFSIKCLSSKWGHCSHDNKIMLNLRLLNTDVEVLNYVIYHELCHIKHKNHSFRFWDEVSKYCPNHKSLRKKLRENPPQIFN